MAGPFVVAQRGRHLCFGESTRTDGLRGAVRRGHERECMVGMNLSRWIGRASAASVLVTVVCARGADESSVACYPSRLTDGQTEHVSRDGALPPTLLSAPGERYILDPLCWTGDGQIGSSGLASPARLTYSFAKDGTLWGIAAISGVGPSDLSSRLIAVFGSGNLELGREYFRAALASWRRFAGVSYSEVGDDNSPMDQSSAHVTTRGDIRIGGRAVGIENFLAYNAFPSTDAGAVIGGGDMFINTSFFLAAYFNDPAGNFRFFRNTIAHEHGHGLGMVHTTPCNNTKLMEPYIATGVDMVQVDELRGAGRSYGDRLSGNHSPSSAHDFGDVSAPSPRSVREAYLSVNGSVGANGTGQDWFRFSLSSARSVTVSVTPTGGVYLQGEQLVQCDAINTGVVNAVEAGNLALELRNSDGTTVLFESSTGAPGMPETVTATLGAGSYLVRVADTGPNSPGSQLVQLYHLGIRVDGQPFPPTAIAGVNKRIWAGAKTFFMGDLNSWTNEPGAVITGYSWDLDGDGVFEASGASVQRTYPSNGVMRATLRVTDSNGLTGTDTIDVTVFNATTTITGIAPSSAAQGATTAVTITGTNFKGLVSAGQFTLPTVAGAVFSGTPVVNTLGTQVSGLSVTIPPAAPAGSVPIAVSNADGLGQPSSNATSGAILAIVPPVAPPGAFVLLSPPDGATGVGMQPVLQWSASAGASEYELILSTDAGLVHPLFQKSGLTGTSLVPPPGTLANGHTYYWGVTSSNSVGTTASSPVSSSFSTAPPPGGCFGDLNGDSARNTADLILLLLRFGDLVLPGSTGDLNNDGQVNTGDLALLLGVFGVAC